MLAIVMATAGCSDGPRVRQPPPAFGQSGTASPSAASSHAAASGPMRESTPVRLRIPAIEVDSEVMALGLRGDGTLDVPPAGFPAGWYTGGPTPGELGPAIMAGHVNWEGSPGVFFSLGELSRGEEILVERDDGSTAVFHVRSVEQFPKDAFPTEAVYADIDHAGLRLITCGGAFDRQAGSYRDNIVVFAELAAEESG